MGNGAQSRNAFTLVELLVAIAILVLVTTVTYSTFAAVTKAWQRGTALSEDLHHGDFVMEQLVSGLRQARYRGPADGLWLQDNGSGPYAHDSISWVKEGAELVGEESSEAKSIHRIKFTVLKNPDDDKPGAAITAWGDEYLHPDDFSSDDLTPVFLSSRIVGFNCRVATNSVETDELDWRDTWDEEMSPAGNQTNHIPRYVELTLFLEPLQQGEAPVEMKRCVDIPVARTPGGIR
jgi:prepilin-type N-terminal cleavage/methylation domain-containing protein